MQIDKIPFSVFGSYVTISSIGNVLKIRNISGSAPDRDIATLELTHEGAPVAPSVRREGTRLILAADHGSVEVCFESEDCLRFRGKGVSLRLSSNGSSPFGSNVELRPRRWLLARHGNRINLVLQALTGGLDVDSPWDGANSSSFDAKAYSIDSSGFELAVELHRTACEAEADHSLSFDRCAGRYDAMFHEYLHKTVSAPARYAIPREEAAYLNWSSVVAPIGLLKRPAMYMSKNWMCNVWSWDHCFNALALSYEDPALAWDQFMVMFDAQDETGALPDCINDFEAVWQFCKPPVHGWTLKKMLENNGLLDKSHIEEAYGPLGCWTDWWFTCRDSDGDGMPEYHHGNDSGWDNSTVFAKGVPVESPDLAALLIVQMDVLSELAARLGREEESMKWKQRADALLDNFTRHFIAKDERLMAVRAGCHEAVECQSLLPYISLILGQRLPEELRRKLVQGLRTSGFMTAHGLATEAPGSPMYQADGYWRGPIWAPSTLLMAEGLKACGEAELAKEVALKFTELCAAQGFAENYDALTGVGLRDPAYTWTSSVFLVFCREYL